MGTMSKGGGDGMIMMKCNIVDCRVKTFIVGNWEDEAWEYEESSAWSMLKNNCCPGCGEESVEVTA